MSKLSPFEIASNINDKSGFLDVAVVGYEPYIVNRALSNVQDTVLFANEMNSAFQLSKAMQYAFLYHAIPKRKRYGKWYKNQDDVENIKLIQEYFGYSYTKAKAVLPLMKGHMEELKKELEKGGKTACHKRY